MNQLISLKTAKFDILKEDENPNNQIYGQSLLLWLADFLKDKFEFSEVESEDWGWYCHIDFKGRNYMLGANAFYDEGEDPTSELEWIFQIEKQRTFKEILLFKEQMNEQDECLLYFKSFFDNVSDITVISVN
ncbi:MAG: hypothetical protein GY751_12630 [Bacteroidetes bacterium]|nr:hypothetical protein [Bacteroidota bacterium]